MQKVLIAGATGYLGKFIVKETAKQGHYVKAFARKKEKLEKLKEQIHEIIETDIAYSPIENYLKDVDVLISTIGITRQKDGLTYMDVDYGINSKLLKAALKTGIKKLIYVSVFRGEELRHLKICQAKEKFVDELKYSGINYCIIRPNGFFSDITEVLNMAKKGTIYLLGKGEYKANPIHGEDLAKICVNNILSDKKEINIGGPELFTQKEIAKIAFETLEKKTRIKYIPLWASKAVLFLLKTFTSSKVYGPIEFFITVISMDMVSPLYGEHKLKNYFEKIKNYAN